MIFSTLNKLNTGSCANVFALENKGPIRQRLSDLGIIPDTNLECLYSSKGNEISAYLVRGSVIALRCEDAKNIVIVPCGVMA